MVWARFESPMRQGGIVDPRRTMIRRRSKLSAVLTSLSARMDIVLADCRVDDP